MSSFLSRRITEQAKREAEERAAQDAAIKGFVEEEEETVPAARAAEASRPRKPVAEPIVEEEYANGSSVPKARTTPKVAQLRKQFRSKLLASMDEADLWSRGDAEKEQLLIGRLKTILQKAGVQLTPQEMKELQEAILNDLMGFGAIEPFVQSKIISEIMVN